MNLSMWRIFGVFSTLLIIGFLLGPAIVGIAKGIKTGSWDVILEETGGRTLALDNILFTETNYLLETTAEEDFNNFDVSFHLVYALSILFIFFFIGVAGYKLGNWLSGTAQFNPIVDIFVMFLVLGLFLSIEFLYSTFVLGVKVYPLQGVWVFIKNLPTIVQNLVF